MTAPAAILAKVARLSIDVGATFAGGMIDAEDARRTNETLDVRRAQRNKFKDRIADLTAKCLQPRTHTENKPQPESTPPAAAKGGGGGKAILGILAGVGAVAGGAIAYAEYKRTMDEADALLSSVGNLPTGASTAPTTSGVSAFNGNCRAQVSRSCTPAGGTCVQAVENATCSPTNFTFSVSNGVIRDCGPWFDTATIQSSGAYSGIYQGSSASSGVPVTGTFTSGGATLRGSATIQGGAYTITIQVTRQ